MISKTHRTFLSILVALLGSAAPAVAQQKPRFEFQITLSESVSDKPITGRLFLFMNKMDKSSIAHPRLGPPQEPRLGPNWFSPEPFFGKQIVMRPGVPVVIDDSFDSFPVKLSTLKPGKYFVQAVLDHNFYSSAPGKGVGNFYSDSITVNFDPEQEKQIKMELTNVVAQTKFVETDWLKRIEIKSEMLSEFHKRPVMQHAAIVLPESYSDQPHRRYPVFYSISGFSGTLTQMTGKFRKSAPKPTADDVEFIRVFLSGECKWGHHVYANSKTNGPRGDAFTQELIQEIDKRFRTIADSKARFVGGHSSGGWSSLWLQVNYPDVFGGVWSTSPDPVDFRDFQQTNLYAKPPESLYFDAEKNRRPLARFGKKIAIWYPVFAKMDDAIGRGGQLRSFEAVFSPLDKNGLPMQLWDRKTGVINPTVAQSWQNYDINLLLRKNWADLQEKLTGKIHVTMGDKDTFYLEGATLLLKETLHELKSDAEIEIIPDATHFDILSKSLQQKHQSQMSKAFLKHYQLDGTNK